MLVDFARVEKCRSQSVLPTLLCTESIRFQHCIPRMRRVVDAFGPQRFWGLFEPLAVPCSFTSDRAACSPKSWIFFRAALATGAAAE